jgi:hypothetical protein
MATRTYTTEVDCCADCPAYRDRDRWCQYSNLPIAHDHDVLEDVAEFCELEYHYD